MANRTTRQLPFPIVPLSAKDILARLGNQADRPPLRSPPLIQPASVLAKLRGPTKPQASSNRHGEMTKALVNQITRMEIHAIYDDANLSTKQKLGDGTPLFLDVPFNPATLDHSIKAKWAELAVPGLSHSRLHYTGTENQTFKFDLLLDYMVLLHHIPSAATSARPTGGEPKGAFPEFYAAKVGDAYRFLQSLLYPKGNAEGPGQMRPPEVLLFWPNALSLHCVLWELSAKWQKMLPTGELASVMVSLTFREIPKKRITLEDVRLKGTLRTEGEAAADPTNANRSIA